MSCSIIVLWAFMSKPWCSSHPNAMNSASMLITIIMLINGISSMAINQLSTNPSSNMMVPWPQRFPQVSTSVIPPSMRDWSYTLVHVSKRSIISTTTCIKHFNYSFSSSRSSIRSFEQTKLNTEESAAVIACVETGSKICPYHSTEAPAHTLANAQFV